jgi:hypothetical protein
VSGAACAHTAEQVVYAKKRADMRRPHERAHKAERVPEARSLTVGTAAKGICAKIFVYIVVIGKNLEGIK